MPLEKLLNQWNSDRRSRQSQPILNIVASLSKAELAATSVWFVGVLTVALIAGAVLALILVFA